MGGYDDVGHVSRSSDLLHVKASLARVSQSNIKTDRGATVGGAESCLEGVNMQSNMKLT
jgi:hypothetical protein